MKTHYLLLALTVGACGCASAKPLLVNPQPTQIVQSAQIADNSSIQADPQKVQSVAAKVTVRVRVGQGMGSGVLLGKKGNTYLVLTNAHVVREDAGITIQTPDGQSYTARKVKDPQVGNFDVALLEFTSNRTYQWAKSDVNSKDNEFALREGRAIFAAGFSHDSNTLQFRSGTVKQLPQEPFVNGTQVGYATQGDIEQGMSGGPILDDQGNLVGINTTYAYPIKPTYSYTDGTNAPSDKVAEYRQVNWGVPIYNLLTRLNPDILYSYNQLPKLTRMVTPTGYMAERDRAARLVTVRIEYGQGNSSGNGSGVIVASDGNSYSVLTAAHVVKKIQDLRVITHDQRTYTISPSDIKRSEGTDLAVVKFTSTQRYDVATLGNYSVSDGAVVFPGGWPAPWKIGSQQWQWQLNPGFIRSKEEGEFITQDKRSFSKIDGDYDLIYSSNTYGGMSGGPVFDSAGRVIGIHGKAEGIGKNILGNSLGISIRTFLGIAERLNVPKHSLQPIAIEAPGNLDNSKLASVVFRVTNPNDSKDANRWIELGNQLYRLGLYADAAKAFDRAISLKPDLLDGYYGKGLALASNNDNGLAIKALDRAIELVPLDKKSKFYYLWKYRSIALISLKRYPEALDSISQAINLEPSDMLLLNEKALLLVSLGKYSKALELCNEIINREKKSWAYNSRSIIRKGLGDNKGAIDDLKLAINIDPQSFKAYNNLGIIQSDLGNKKEAIADYGIAIGMNRQFAPAYNNRGTAKYDLGDKENAINDFNIAININPRLAEPYNNRGLAEYDAQNDLGDSKKAIADFNTAISINPQYAEAYSNRGNAKSALGDKKGAINDLKFAIDINPRLAEAYLNLGGVEYDLGHKEKAIKDYDIAISIKPQLAMAYNNRGLAKYDLGDKENARKDYDEAIRINPRLALAYYNRGNAKRESGDQKSAIADYDIAISINPQDALAYNNRGLVKDKLGYKESAMKDYDDAIRINPRLAIAYYNRGNSKDNSGDKKGAIKDYDDAIHIDPQYASAYYNRGAAKYDLGDKKGAIENLKIAAQLFKSQNRQADYEKVMSVIQQFSS